MATEEKEGGHRNRDALQRNTPNVKLVIPYVGELRGPDARLARLAAFLGVSCETLPLPCVAGHAEFLERAVPESRACFVVNPRVMQEWVGPGGVPAGLADFLRSRFSRLLVHGVRVDPFDGELVAALTRGKLKAVHAIDTAGSAYRIAGDSRAVCEAFAGLSFGPVNPANDHVFHVGGSDPAVSPLISIGGNPFMASVELEATEILCVASEDVADLDAEVGEAPLAEFFSRLVPHAMALRRVAGDECWRPREAHAAIIIDDPLLRKNYGFLNFDALLRLADAHDFHAVLAFIPHNFRRNSPRITRMFREHAARLSICFHGNDHTEAELASADPAFLHTLLRVADERMDALRRRTGLACDRVMVFPQGNFSVAAMKALYAHDYLASVNTVPHPTGRPEVRLTLGELARPAVLRYAGFPLFMRQSIQRTGDHDVAFNLFFGRPVLIGEHHDLFQRPEPLAEFADRVNAMAPGIRWSNLTSVASHAVLTRRAPDGTRHVRAYANAVRVTNDAGDAGRYCVEWDRPGDGAPVEQVRVDGVPRDDFEMDDAGLRLALELAPGQSRTFSLVHHHGDAARGSLGLRWNAHAFVRRRLSEFRDNYLSKNPQVLMAARTLQRRFLK